MKTLICTGWHPPAWNLYARTFFETFYRNWSTDTDIVAYVEEMPDAGRMALPGTALPFHALGECPGVLEFIARNKTNKAAHGLVPRPGFRARERSRGYSFRFDAVKFCKQLFIPEAAAMGLNDGDVLAWMDADVVVYEKVPEGLIPGLLGDADLCYLGRGHKHSEIGFWAVRIGPYTRQFLSMLADQYREDLVFSLQQWHSAFVFDHVRTAWQHTFPVKVTNLTPNGTDHVWFQCELGKYTDHLKGERRKKQGFSEERRRINR